MNTWQYIIEVSDKSCGGTEYNVNDETDLNL